MHFVPGHPGRPVVGGRPPAVVGGKPLHRHPGAIVGGAFILSAPFFWYPPYPYYPYYPYPYGYVPPAYGGPAYTETPTYIEQSNVHYFCPDSQDYYPNVQTCPSPWMPVVPGTGAPVTN